MSRISKIDFTTKLQMLMRTSVLKFLGAAIAALTVSTLAHATPIGGEVSFSGVVSWNTGNITTATALSFGTGANTATVSGATASGSYAGVVTQNVTGGIMSGTAGSLTFDPVLIPDPATIWSFTQAGITYSFKLGGPIDIARDTTTPSLTLSGWGTASITGYTDTAGFWSLTSQGTNATVTFSSSTSVPDNGMTALLLGSGLVLIGIVAFNQRKRIAA